MIASLMMYCRPELEGAHARYWALIRAELASRGIAAPEELADDLDEFEVWKSPDLVLSQTCGMPYRLWLHTQVTLIGTPDFGVPGCPPGHYNSAIVVRADDARATLADYRKARFTYNQTFSQSGYAAIHAQTARLGFWFAERRRSHGHLHSACAVADGRADIAALDAVSWRLIQRYERFAERLRVLEHTSPTPGLPYIAGPSADRTATAQSVAAAMAQLDASDRSALGIIGLTDIPKSAYLAVPNPPDAG